VRRLVAVVVFSAGCEQVLDVLGPAGAIPVDDGGARDADTSGDAQADANQPGSCPGRNAIGLSCASSEECCSGYCTLGPTNEATCRPTTGCVGIGGACTRAGACCSLGCSGGTDQPEICAATKCAQTGASCARSNDCCSNKCVSNACIAAGAGCRPAGEACATDADCCGRVCADEHGEGILTCAIIQGCRPEGETCDSSADCCSARCAADPSGVMRCSALAACTSGDKKPCSRQVGDVCKDANECCSRQCVTTGDGTKRCAPAGGCRGECETCSSGADCCSKLCAPDATGVNRCQPATCGTPGEICDKDPDCCAGSKCTPDPAIGGPKRCHVPAGTQCTNASCALASECCGGVHCTPNADNSLFCTAACAPVGARCSARADCCNGGSGIDCLSIAGIRTCTEIVR
jgi:hypothetical protein